jgi:cyclopropane-fatty-acyl-phospholipid synthase
MDYPSQLRDRRNDVLAASFLPQNHAGFLERRYARMLARAGIRINGARPWDLRVHDPRFFRRLLWGGTLGLGDSYVEGWWDAARLDSFFERLIRARIDHGFFNLPRLLGDAAAALRNAQDRMRARRVGEVHYDLSNSFYAAMLDARMVYTCGYWRVAKTLDAAQEAKLELVCAKIGLERGMRVLDVGCGWGSFARYAAERYGATVVGVTISREQAALAREHCRGLPVEIREQDYRDVRERFDRVVSLGMFEHVGRKNYRTYFETARRCLADDGLFLLHTIGLNEHGAGIDPWVTRHIFPNSEIPTLARVVAAIDRLFVVEDLHNFGSDYAPTLLSWYANFERHWPAFAAEFPSSFERLWKYYLLMFAGVFRGRGLQLWQFVLAAPHRPGAYRRPLR